MKFIDLVKSRRSARGFCDAPVEREKIELCLEAARLAPSACNSQPWRFVVVTDVNLKNNIAAECVGPMRSFNTFVSQAPVIVAVVTEPGKVIPRVGGAIKDKNYSRIDVGIAVEHFCLQAAEIGLGSCILGWFHEENVRKLIGAPAEKRIDLLVALGYPSDAYAAPAAKQRKSIDEIRAYERY